MLGFELGCRAPLLVREERVGSQSESLSEATQNVPWRLLYASDLHLTRRRRGVAAELVELAAGHAPDAILLGGDLVDRKNGIPILRELVVGLTAAAPVAAVPGNHEHWFRGVAADVREAAVAGGASWLPDADRLLQLPGRGDLLLTSTARLGPPGRSGAQSPHRVHVGHRPDVAADAGAGCDLVLAGHLHGGQCVLWQRGQMLYPGAWFTRWNGLRFDLAGTPMLVSRGVADTLPVRFRCPREVILVTLC